MNGEARLLLEQAGLEVGEIKREYSEEYEEEVVFEQSLSAEEEVSSGEEIGFTVSLGPAPDRVKVPGVTDLDLEEAEKKLREAGLQPGEVEYQYSFSHAEEIIISQEPNVGHEVDFGSSVDLIVSRGAVEDEEGKKTG